VTASVLKASVAVAAWDPRDRSAAQLARRRGGRRAQTTSTPNVIGVAGAAVSLLHAFADGHACKRRPGEDGTRAMRKRKKLGFMGGCRGGTYHEPKTVQLGPNASG
jgi:hypothetical protein